MTYCTANRRLMKRLGFVADPPTRPQIVPHDRATYWRHQPSQACVVTFHDSRYTEAKVVRAAITAAIAKTRREVGDKVSSTFSAAHSANENAAAEWQRGKKKS